MPQEIDGKGGENPSLCRNRVVPQDKSRALSRNASRKDSPRIPAAMHRRLNGHTTMILNTIAPYWSTAPVVPALMLAGFISSAHASELPTVSLAPVTVSAHGGSSIPYDNTGVSVTVLDIPELKREGITNLAEAITRAPGVYVQPGGGSNQRGNVSNIAIRGMSSSQFTLPMLDGLRLYDNSGGCNLTPNVLARTNLFDLGTLEVLRGSQGAVYGSGAIGGVIYMETPEGEGEPSCSIFNEFGSFSSYTGNLTAQGRQESLSYFFSATYETSDNDLKRVDGSKPEDSQAGHYENWQEALRLDYRPDKDTHARFTYRRSDSRYQAPDAWGDPHYQYRTNLISGTVEKKVTHAFATELSGGYYGADYTFGKGTDHDLRNVQLNWRNEYRWCRHQATTAGLAFMHGEHSSENNGQRNQGDAHEENMFSLFAEHRVTPVENWENTLALRWDASDVFDTLYTLRAATSMAFNDERTRLSASFARGYKAPSSFQRMRGQYEAYGSLYIGNPELDCQTSWSADIGLEHEWMENHTASITLFWIRTADAIRTNWVADHYEFANASGADTSKGIELSLQGTWEEQWNTGYTLSLTLCDPETNEGRQIAATSRQVWAVDIHTSPIAGFTTGIGLSAASGCSNWDSTPLDSRLVLRWYAHYELNQHLSFHVRVENLTNEKFVSDTAWGDFGKSYLNPGTAVYGGCTLTF